MEVESRILGDLKVESQNCFDFPDGILGFPACERFVLVPAERRSFFWLQSVDCGALAFLLVDPFALFDDFFVDLPEGDLGPLRAEKDSEIAILAIVTLPGKEGEAPTANLQGILAFNLSQRIARQVVIQNSPYSVRWPMNMKKLKAAS
jgi:flagellar assembly factor FliW